MEGQVIFLPPKRHLPGELSISGEFSAHDVADTDLVLQGYGGEVLGGHQDQAETEHREELHPECTLIPVCHKNEENRDESLTT